MRISDWSSDVCSSDLGTNGTVIAQRTNRDRLPRTVEQRGRWPCPSALLLRRKAGRSDAAAHPTHGAGGARQHRSEEHTSELQSLMRISYAVFCLKKKKQNTKQICAQTQDETE